MNGANAEDSVKTTKRESRNRNMKIGASHHLLDVFRKKINSEKTRNRLRIRPRFPALLFLRFDKPGGLIVSPFKGKPIRHLLRHPASIH